jgi:hypothetical protein
VRLRLGTHKYCGIIPLTANSCFFFCLSVARANALASAVAEALGESEREERESHLCECSYRWMVDVFLKSLSWIFIHLSLNA